MLSAGDQDEVALTTHPGHQQTASSVHYTTSCKHSLVHPEDGRNYSPKRVELIEIINKPLFLHLVGCLFHSG